MKLTYKILWIDDSEDLIESFPRGRLESHIEGQGFEFSLETRVSPDEVKSPIDGSKYDLLIIDYNLTESGPNGDDLIKTIRDHDCLTEVIFYSANVDGLRDAAISKELDGVFFSNKQTEPLLRKICDVVDLTIRKVIDLENMRGIVMAGVADLDHLLKEIVQQHHQKMEEAERLEYRRYLLKKMVPDSQGVKRLIVEETHAVFSAFENSINEICRLSPKEFEELVKSRAFDSYKKVMAVCNACKGRPEISRHQQDVNSIRTLLDWRNALAHQRPIIDNSIEFFEIGGARLPFDQARARELRQDIRRYRSLLEEVIGSISD